MQEQTTTQDAPYARELPGLAGIGGFIRWIEELVSLLSGPLLTVGLAIALIDLLTNGTLLNDWPFLLFAWGVCQAVGIDSQLVATFDKLRRALRERRWLTAIGLLMLGVLLGAVGFLSAEAFGFQHAFGVTEAQALARLNIDPVAWQFIRSALAVFLVALSGFTRYHPPAKNLGAKTAEEKERLEAELKLEPLRAQLRNQKVRDLRAAALTAVGREVPQPTGAKSMRSIGAASVMPEPAMPVEHHAAVMANNQMHDWDIVDETDGLDPLGADPNATGVIPPYRLGIDSGAAKTARRAARTIDPRFLDGADDYDDDWEPPASRSKPRTKRTMNNGEMAAETKRKNGHVNNAVLAEKAVAVVMNKALADGVTNINGENIGQRYVAREANNWLDAEGYRLRIPHTTAKKWMNKWVEKQQEMGAVFEPESEFALEGALS